MVAAPPVVAAAWARVVCENDWREGIWRLLDLGHGGRGLFVLGAVGGWGAWQRCHGLRSAWGLRCGPQCVEPLTVTSPSSSIPDEASPLRLRNFDRDNVLAAAWRASREIERAPICIEQRVFGAHVRSVNWLRRLVFAPGEATERTSSEPISAISPPLLP